MESVPSEQGLPNSFICNYKKIFNSLILKVLSSKDKHIH